MAKTDKLETVGKEDWLQRAFDGEKVIREIAYSLQSLAAALYRTGNDPLSQELYEDAADLLKATETISGAIGESVRESFRASEQASRNMLMTAFAVGGSDEIRQSATDYIKSH